LRNEKRGDQGRSGSNTHRGFVRVERVWQKQSQEEKTSSLQEIAGYRLRKSLKEVKIKLSSAEGNVEEMGLFEDVERVGGFVIFR
jgi:hypothetical protein